ncbi:MAG: MCE family protein [Actinomycetota bacterium]|nr:MCE family protein [Actinomycetota bacterium]
MNWFRRRDPAVLAIVITLIGAVVVLLAINLARLPFVHPKTSYSADFANTGGLQTGDDVRVAGISVGAVTSIKLEGTHVKVDFTVKKGLKLGGTSGATVEIATVLGALFLQVESAGPGTLASGATIPLSRTTVPYTLLDAFNGIGEATINTNQPNFRASLTDLAATLQGIRPADVTATLKGVTAISTALSSRQKEIGTLLSDALNIVSTLNSKRGDLVKLLANSGVLLQLFNDRATVITTLLHDTATLGQQISSLVSKNGGVLAATLANLSKVTAVLTNDRNQLQASVTTLGEFSTNIANVAGSGPWLDLLLPTGFLPDNLITACGKTPAPGCGRP